MRTAGGMVLYWMIAQRRRRSNFALEHAVDWSRRLGKPLVVLEALRCAYPYASDRLHRFVIEGMADNRVAFARTRVCHLPYVEPRPGDGSGLLEALAREACLVVTDEWPCFFLPRMVGAAAALLARMRVRCEAVDGNGLLPMRAAPRMFERAVDFRRHLQRALPEHLLAFPAADPLAGASLPDKWRPPLALTRRWPEADLEALLAPDGLARLPIDHAVAPVDHAGGAVAAASRLRDFIADDLPRYAEAGRDLDHPALSRLSPYLHFGHLSPHQVARAVFAREGWSLDRLGASANGRKQGWWGMPPAAEAFMDQLVTWRELGFNRCFHQPDAQRYATLPAWARATLANHPRSPAARGYSLRRLSEARTDDPIWNAAQRELTRDGRIHGYLRMLWGKHILAWSPSPRAALARILELNDRFAVDGRDPNSISGITWIFGRYDHPWPPARPGFGTVRYMSSDSARRKLDMDAYLERYGGDAP